MDIDSEGLQDLLALVLTEDKLPTIEFIETLTSEQKNEAEDWAVREILYANDNYCVRAEKPNFLGRG